MKRSRPIFGTLSSENAAHPFVQILSHANLSTVRNALIEALPCAATCWSLQCIVPGVLRHSRLEWISISHASDCATRYDEPITPELQTCILTAYRMAHIQNDFVGWHIQNALCTNAPYAFVMHLWNNFLQDKERCEYIDRFLGGTMELYGTWQRVLNCMDAIQFYWNNVFWPNRRKPAFNTNFVMKFLRDILEVKFTFESIHWFWTQLMDADELPHVKIFSFYEIYTESIAMSNFDAAIKCWNYMSRDQQQFVQFHVQGGEVYSLLMRDEHCAYRVDEKLYDFLMFIQNTHLDYCPLTSFWRFVEWCAEVQCTEAVGLFLVNMYDTHVFPASSADVEAKYFLNVFFDSFLYNSMFIFNNNFLHVLQRIQSHTLFLPWLRKLHAKSTEKQECCNMLIESGFSGHVIKSVFGPVNAKSE